MSVVDRWVELEISQADVWRLVRDFAGHDVWMLSGGKKFDFSERTGNPNGFHDTGEPVFRSYQTSSGTVTEQLISVDDMDFVLRYTLTESPIRVENFRGSIAVSDNNDGTASVFWRAEYSVRPEDSAEVEQFLGHWFERGLRSLKHLVQQGV